MRHGIAGRKLSRTSEHRQAMFANMAASLIEHEQIKTTLPKAKDLRRVVEPLITKAKKGDLAARREVLKTIRNKDIVKKLFDDVAPLFAKRSGGYTRIIKAGHRLGDAADMAIIELTERTATEAPAKAAPAKAKKAESKPASEKKEAKPAAEKKESAKKETKSEASKEEAKKDSK